MWPRPGRARGVTGTSDPSRAIAQAVALLESGLAPGTVWELVGLDVDERGDPRVGDGDLAHAVAAAATLTRDGGMPLAGVLRRVLTVVRARQDAADAREAALAGPRMSARVLAWLPLAGLGLAALLDPGALRLVVTTPVGWVLLALAGSLTWAGRRWTRALLARADPPQTGVPAPLALALLDAVLAAGLDVGGALTRVGVVVDGAAGDALIGAARGLAAGLDWAHAWDGARHGADAGARSRRPRRRPPDPNLPDVIREALRAAHLAGASAAPSLRAAMEEELRGEKRRGQRAAAELSVTLTLPLTLCLLPAFILVGVVPLIAAVIASVDLGGLA